MVKKEVANVVTLTQSSKHTHTHIWHLSGFFFFRFHSLNMDKMQKREKKKEEEKFMNVKHVIPHKLVADNGPNKKRDPI